MAHPIYEVPEGSFPPLLREIPQPPKRLYARGELPRAGMKLLSVVGSRKYSTYGKEVVEYLIRGLRGYPIGIVSGLALGIDSLAHEAALREGLYTLAVPGSGIDDAVIYPASHRGLAARILEHGGGLLSEFAPDFRATKWSFTQRNRIMAGIAPATLLIEAGEQSGTLITARMAADYNRELLVVPGSIFSHNSRGVHQFLKLGATPVTTAEDILEALGIEERAPAAPSSRELTPAEAKVLDALTEPKDADTLAREAGLTAAEANILLMEMEFKGYIVSSGGRYRAVI
jgi:DNA processing protein